MTQAFHLASQSRMGRENGPRALGHRAALLWAVPDVGDTREVHHHHPLTNWKWIHVCATPGKHLCTFQFTFQFKLCVTCQQDHCVDTQGKGGSRLRTSGCAAWLTLSTRIILNWGGDALLVPLLFYTKLPLLPAAPGVWCAQRKISKMLLLTNWQTTEANSLEKWRILKGSAK